MSPGPAPRALLALVLATVGSLAASPAARAEGSERLEALRERIGASRERVEGHEARERALLDRLEEIDRSLSALEARVRAAHTDAKRARAALDEIERETARLSDRLAATRKAMSARAVALYKTGELGPIRVLFASGSLRELLQRSATLQSLLEYDTRLALRFERDQAAYEAARSDAEKATIRNERAEHVLHEQRQALERERGSKRTVMAAVRRDRVQERSLLVELERAARALETTIAELGEGERRHGGWIDGSGFGKRRGSLPLPVEAPISGRFGRVRDAEFLTETIRNGVEFGAQPGEPVRATARGEVRFAGWFRGYGKIVILDHGDSFFTISGHLSELEVGVGDLIDEGDVIGRVGDTGSLTGPMLYFELREGSKPQDPARWFSPDRLAEAS